MNGLLLDMWTDYGYVILSVIGTLVVLGLVVGRMKNRGAE